jgi:hypothetical protein
MPAYFFVAVSNRENLELCKRYSVAGFTSSINGVWAYSDIDVGDYISFVYGAKAHNLYRVGEKEALRNAEEMPPWRPLVFVESGKVYHFPFRLYLEPVRSLEESLVRSEFAYIAENLLLRGGYRRTHFQADRTTLQNVSEMGRGAVEETEILELPSKKIFEPQFVRGKVSQAPEIFPLNENILQALIRKYLLYEDTVNNLLDNLGISCSEKDFEALGEKAFPQGHVDILLKEAHPVGTSVKVVVEVKLTTAKEGHIDQLRGYLRELGSEGAGGVLIAERFPKKLRAAGGKDIACFRYSFGGLNLREPHTFGELLENLQLEKRGEGGF